jgi:acetyl esterase/lipase
MLAPQKFFVTRQAGGVAELHVWPGGFHGFTILAPQAALSKHALEATTNWYRRLLASHRK